MSGQVMSSHSVVSSSRTVRPCSAWGGRCIGHWRTIWSTVCSSSPHSQAAEEAIPHLYKQERKGPTLVRRRLNRTQALLGRVIPGVCVPVSGIKSGVLWGCPTTPRSIDDPPTALHVCCCCQRSWWVVVRQAKWVSRFEEPCNSTRWTGERWVEQMSRLHGTAS